MTGRPTAADPYGEQGALALPTAPVFRGQRGKGAGATFAKNSHGYQQPRGGWGKRHATGRRYSDGMGPMLSTRPASRQAQSDLMDLNLALKFDKMGTESESKQPKERSLSHARSTTRSGRRLDRGAVTNSPSESRRYSAPVDRQVRQTPMRYLSPSERYNVEAHAPNTTSAKLDIANQFNEADVSASLKQDIPAQNDWGGGLHSATSYVVTTTTCEAPPMIPPSGYYETHEGKGLQGKSLQGKGLQGGRGSSVSTFPEEMEVAPQARGRSGSSVWKSGSHQGCDTQVYGGGRGYGDEAQGGRWTEFAEERERGNHSPCQETSSQQSEKDQRMWFALKTSLLAEEGSTDSSIVGSRIGKTDDGSTPDCGSDNNTFLKGARDMEQLDLERSAMDRTMRPHRVASARLLETTQDSPVQTKVKQPRTFSASATRSRTHQNEPASSVWAGAGGTLQCTGVRAELVSRNGDGQSGFCSESPDGVDAEGYTTFPGETRTRRRDGSHQLARKVEQARFQWVTNDEGVANFLQRPPSRQKEAFPTHLADVIPYPAFQVEVPLADDEAKQHIEATRKNAVEQTRPPSRHKPPGQSLFLEVPETRRHVPPVFSPSRGTGTTGTESCSALPSGMPMDVPDVEASPTTRDSLGDIFTLDRRHDNPDRDGFSVLQVQGPCPFRIEVTNSFMQRQPPTVPLGREAVPVSNPRKTAKYCPPDPSCGLFGPMTYESGGRTSTGKQRAPINTTPTLAGSAGGSPVPARGDAGGKNCPMSSRLLGSRSTGGIALRSTSITAPCSARGDDSTTVDAPTPPPPTRNGNRELRVEGRSTTREGGDVCGLREGGVEEGGGRRADASGGGDAPSPGRGETSGLLVSTGAPVLNVSDWSLQSCDDADDGAFLDGPGSTLGESGGTKHSLLETTLGQDFLSLFAPSPGRNNSSGSRVLQ